MDPRSLAINKLISMATIDLQSYYSNVRPQPVCMYIYIYTCFVLIFSSSRCSFLLRDFILRACPHHVVCLEVACWRVHGQIFSVGRELFNSIILSPQFTYPPGNEIFYLTVYNINTQCNWNLTPPNDSIDLYCPNLDKGSKCIFFILR